jgi:hypothetical protein
VVFLTHWLVGGDGYLAHEVKLVVEDAIRTKSAWFLPAATSRQASAWRWLSFARSLMNRPSKPRSPKSLASLSTVIFALHDALVLPAAFRR